MAEYIDREKAIEQAKAVYHCAETIEELGNGIDGMLEYLPTADVVEHSKIDKAIEEMQCYLTTSPSNEEWIDGINYCIEIIKRNIGE